MLSAMIHTTNTGTLPPSTATLGRSLAAAFGRGWRRLSRALVLLAALSLGAFAPVLRAAGTLTSYPAPAGSSEQYGTKVVVPPNGNVVVPDP